MPRLRPWAGIVRPRPGHSRLLFGHQGPAPGPGLECRPPRSGREPRRLGVVRPGAWRRGRGGAPRVKLWGGRLGHENRTPRGEACAQAICAGARRGGRLHRAHTRSSTHKGRTAGFAIRRRPVQRTRGRGEPNSGRGDDLCRRLAVPNPEELEVHGIRGTALASARSGCMGFSKLGPGGVWDDGNVGGKQRQIRRTLLAGGRRG
jgi:hypothetical protein